MILIILAIGMFGAATFMLLSGLTVRQREVAVTLRKAKRYGIQSQREVETRRSVNDRLVGPLTAKVAGITQRLLPRTDPNLIANRLMAAGLARSMSPQMYLALKGGLVFVAVAFGAVVLLSGVVAPAIGMLVALGGSAVGYIAPDFFINSRTRARREMMQMELPNVLDLLCVSVEAGLGFDAAVAKLSERMVGPLVDEFGLVLHEMRIGESRSEALKNLSERVDVREVSQFCRAIIQADQLGIALSRILRVQSHDMRVRRQLAAEEKAMKAPVKMLFPTVLFVFPSMFVVALGPAALNLMQTFSGGGAK
jgi:tight adherence protein C